MGGYKAGHACEVDRRPLHWICKSNAPENAYHGGRRKKTARKSKVSSEERNERKKAGR